MSSPPTPSVCNRRRALVLLAAALSAASGYAAEDARIEKCNAELGTLTVAEPQAHVISGLNRHGLGSPSVMLRMMVQESGCFAVVERGVGMQNLQQERLLGAQGQLQTGSNIGGGQMAVADFVMTPVVQFSGDSGGVGGSLGGLLNKAGLGALSGLAGGVKFKEAETNLLVADVRSGIQIASAEGKASKMNFAVGGWGWGGLGWAGGGGYTKTPEGKLIAASLLDNYNRIVQQVRDKPSLVRSSSQASVNNAAQSIQATGRGAAAQMPAATMAVPAVQPQRAQRSTGSTSMLPDGLFGNFTGQYIGAEPGDFLISVGADGSVNGMGRSGNNTFSFSGMAMANGLLMMRGQGPTGMMEFVGQINASTGDVTGSWKLPQAGGVQGSFSGKRAQ